MTHVEKVTEFHTKFGHPVRTTPNANVPEKVLRMNLIQEEVTELGEALGLTYDSSHNEWYDPSPGKDNTNLVEVADALADIDYVVSGATIVFGIPHDEIFDHVHDSNMSKLGEDGKPILRKDGKILKGPNYWAPNISQFLDK